MKLVKYKALLCGIIADMSSKSICKSKLPFSFNFTI
jgi:hypothetical protein